MKMMITRINLWNMNFKVFTGLVSLLILTQAVVIGQPASETREYEKSFLVKGEMSLEVTNKYGKVHLSHTGSDSVNIRVQMNAYASSSQKLDKLVNGVVIDMNATNYFILAETKFIKGPANLFESIRSITNNLISSESRLDINYYIQIPDNVKVKVDNRYGDIYIESMSCDLDIKMSNGSLKGEDLTGDNSFDLDFYDATINSLNKARFNLSYGELKVLRADELNINSSASRIDLEKVGLLKINSKRDKFYIGELSSIAGESYFTEFNIESLKTSAGLSTRYGSLTVNTIHNGFELFSVDSDYTSVYLRALPVSSFNIDIRVNNCPITIPEEWLLEEKVINEERNEYLYFGKTGSKESRSQLKLNASRGKLVLDQK